MKVRLLRGQVVVREIKRTSSIIITPDANPRSIKTHRGIVLQMGPPALFDNRHEVPFFFNVGDEVIFHFDEHEDKRTRKWVDGEPAVWLKQMEVDAVVEHA